MRRRASRPLWIFASFFSFMPGSERKRPSAMAFSRSSAEVTPSFLHTRLTPLGPSPGRRSSSSSPAGTSASSSSWYELWPVATSSWSFAAMPAPTPGTSCSFSPRRIISTTSRVRVWIDSPANRYERMRKTLSPLISSTSAISCRTRAREWLSTL